MYFCLQLYEAEKAKARRTIGITAPETKHIGVTAIRSSIVPASVGGRCRRWFGWFLWAGILSRCSKSGRSKETGKSEVFSKVHRDRRGF